MEHFVNLILRNAPQLVSAFEGSKWNIFCQILILSECAQLALNLWQNRTFSANLIFMTAPQLALG
jgi:hypothetical protein